MKSHNSLFALATCMLIPAGTMAQTINLSGRVLEKANNDPVPNALVSIQAYQKSTFTDANGNFILTGSTSVGSLRPVTEWPLLRGRYLQIPSGWAAQPIRIEVFDCRGMKLAGRVVPAREGGSRVDLLPEMGTHSSRFLRVSAEGESFRFRLSPSEAGTGETVTELPALAKAAATNVSVDFSKSLLVTKTLVVRSDSGNLGNIILDYPPRKVDTGAPPIYGAITLFDGKMDSAHAKAQLDSNWIMWVGPSSPAGMGPTPILWKMLHDPQAETNPNRWTFSECCAPVPGGATWGYNDIVTKRHFKDYELHVEFNLMGAPGDENPSGYCNSGVYQSNRYELQIETVPTPWDPNYNHGMASIINEYAPPANYVRPQGIWQAYDITFRNDRWVGNTRSEFARTTIWWNGNLIHNNRKIAGSIACCDNGNVPIDSTLQGLKLQNEKGADVRFRNIWIKTLNIPDTLTNFGY